MHVRSARQWSALSERNCFTSRGGCRSQRYKEIINVYVSVNVISCALRVCWSSFRVIANTCMCSWVLIRSYNSHFNSENCLKLFVCDEYERREPGGKRWEKKKQSDGSVQPSKAKTASDPVWGKIMHFQFMIFCSLNTEPVEVKLYAGIRCTRWFSLVVTPPWAMGQPRGALLEKW